VGRIGVHDTDGRAAEFDPFDDGYIFRALLDGTGDSVYVKDRDCRLVRVSQQMARNLGFARPQDLIGKSDFALFGREFAERTYLEDMRVMETDRPLGGLVESRRLAEGGLNWTLTTKMPLHDESGKVVGVMGVTREINELKQAETNLQFLATHDTLTGLPNRYLMTDRLSQVLVRSQREGEPFAVLFADLDDFKQINDCFGHTAGDDLLRTTARRLRSTVRASDTVARIGGDEFVIIVEGANQQAATLVALKVVRAVSAVARIKGRRTRVTASVGIAIYPDHGRDEQGLVTAADHAMYLAKRNGKNGYLVFPTATDAVPASSAKPA
jgi:diguanylate cyclase (GGDEF)-like protein/PAS domain S-box-containing protein